MEMKGFGGNGIERESFKTGEEEDWEARENGSSYVKFLL